MSDDFVADEEVMETAGCGVNALSGLQILANSIYFMEIRPDKRSASGFSLLLQRLMSRLMGQQQGD